MAVVRAGRTSADIRDLLVARLGTDVGLDEASEPDTFDVSADHWVEACRVLRDEVSLTYFDWLSAVDLGPDGFQVVSHLARVGTPGHVAHWLVRTSVPSESPRVGSLTGVYRGAAWHERETYEMFGIVFDDHPYLVPLLLPDGFEGHPLRKDFVLVARATKEWPGAKEPGEPAHGGPARRRMQPPGVPDESWGPRPAVIDELSGRTSAPTPGEPDNSDAGPPGRPS